MNKEAFEQMVKATVDRVEMFTFKYVKSEVTLVHAFEKQRHDITSLLSWKLHLPTDCEGVVPWSANQLQIMLNELAMDFHTQMDRIKSGEKE